MEKIERSEDAEEPAAENTEEHVEEEPSSEAETERVLDGPTSLGIAGEYCG